MLDSPEALLRSIRFGEGAHPELKEVVFAGDRVKGPAREQLADELRDVRRRVAVDDPRRRPGRRRVGGGHVTADAGRDMAE